MDQSFPANTKCTAIAGLAPGGWGITLTSGQIDADNDFGNWQNATKTGMKFHDLNANGVKDAGEPGLAGWTITAYADTNGNGIRDAGENTVAATTVTGAGGTYSLSLAPGKYIVCETQQAGWTQSYPANSACGAGLGGWGITLASGELDSGNDFGNWQKATKTGMKFHDLDADGVKDAGEPGLPGWTITAYADANGNGIRDAGENTVAATQVTGAGGTYSLSLNPGRYVVCETQQAGWTQSFPANAACGAGAGGWGINLASGELDSGNDFGNWQKATKTGMKFNDLDMDGVKDEGEPGLAGWTITAYVDANGNGLRDAGENTVAASAVTGQGGTYSLSLDPGRYLVCETQQAGWTQSFPANNVCGTAQGGWAITLTSGQLDSGNDFGNFQQATKTGMKFHDLNANGVKDAGEPGLPGWHDLRLRRCERERHPRQRRERPRRPGCDGRGRHVLAEPQARQVRRLRGAAGRLDAVLPDRRQLRQRLRLGDRPRRRPGRLGQRLRELPQGDEVGPEVRGHRTETASATRVSPSSRAGSSGPTATRTATARSRWASRRSRPRPRRTRRARTRSR